MQKTTNKQLNFTLLYGIVLKKTSKYILIDYGHGKIKVLLEEFNDTSKIGINYTISVSGYIKQNFISTSLIAHQISIFDTKPHYIKLGN